MLHQLKRHPWTIAAHFDWSLALVFAVEPNSAAGLLPPGLEPDLYDDNAFVAAAMVQTRRLRPTWAPPFLDNDFLLAGYRVFVRCRQPDGRRWRGLYILGSETDSWRMTWLGRALTHYGYQHRTMNVVKTASLLEISAQDRTGNETLGVRALLEETDRLPAGSPFPDLSTARRFAGPMPFTFSHEPQTNRLLVVEGARQHWQPRPVSVEIRRCAFFERPPFSQAGLPALANAFYVENVDYRWKPGRLLPALDPS